MNDASYHRQYKETRVKYLIFSTDRLTLYFMVEAGGRSLDNSD